MRTAELRFLKNRIEGKRRRIKDVINRAGRAGEKVESPSAMEPHQARNPSPRYPCP
jgi:hypothetical protein